MHNEVFGAAESRVNAKVPSLYVRVYRRFVLMANMDSGSLTVCEGVSEAQEARANGK